MPNKDTNFALRSKQVQSGLLHKPGFLEKWSILLLLLLLAVLVTCAGMINYPAFLKAEAIIMAENPPAQINIKRDAKRVFITVKDSQWVKTGDSIGWADGIATTAMLTINGQGRDSNKYCLRSPAAGQIIFTPHITGNTALAAGTTVAWVYSANTKYFASITFPRNYAGDLKQGDTVQLRLDGLHNADQDYLQGRLEKIQTNAADSSVIATIALKASTGAYAELQVEHKGSFKGAALIYTKEKSLLQSLIQVLMQKHDD